MGAKAIVKMRFVPIEESGPLAKPVADACNKTIRELIWHDLYIEAKETGYTDTDAKELADLMTSDYDKQPQL